MFSFAAPRATTRVAPTIHVSRPHRIIVRATLVVALERVAGRGQMGCIYAGRHPYVSFRFNLHNYIPDSASFTSPGISKIVSATGTFAAFKAATLPWAVPVLPEMIAPAWPMRFPGGAVRPEMKATTGLVIVLIYSAASSS